MSDLISKDQLIAKLEKQLADANKENGKLEEKLNLLEKSILILHVRSRIEELEHRFLKPYMLSWTRYNKWNKILRGSIQHLKNQAELSRFRATVTVDIEELINTIVGLYKEFSDVAAHGIHYPIKCDDDSIREMLVKNKMAPDQSKIEAVKIILKPIP